MKADSPLWFTCRWCGSCACSFARWTLWLLLSALLALQLYVVAARQFPVPAFLLRAIESRFAVSQLTVHFRSATFDPSGHLLAEDVRLESRIFAEPLFTARAIYVRLDPWALLAGHFDPREICVTHASLFVPAMLSPTGRTEAFVSDGDFTAYFTPRQRAIKLAQFNCRIGNLVVTARGGLHLPESAAPAANGLLPLAEFIAHNYPHFSRQLARLDDELASLDEPQLQIELTPSDARGAFVTAVLTARAFHREIPWPMRATELRATAKMPLLGQAAAPASLDLSAAEFFLPTRANTQAVRVQLQGIVWPDQFHFVPRTVDFSAATFGGWSVQGTDLIAHLTPGPLPGVQAEIEADVAGTPVSLHGQADLKTQNARVGFDIALGPALLAQVSARMHSHFSSTLAFTSPIALHGDAEFADGWNLADLSTYFEAKHVTVKGVPVDAVRGWADLRGHDLNVTDVILHQHDNFASGSYSMDTATLDYRFLLHGRLRPLEIANWFHPEWAGFWKDFSFPTIPPEGDADAQGTWGPANRSDVFVFADAASPIVHTVPFDRVRAILHIVDGNYYDAREVLLGRGGRTARGHFTRLVDPVKDTWSRMEFDATSNLDLTEGARIFGPDGEDFIAPFKFAQPPTVHATGVLESPAAPGGEHKLVQIVVASSGLFKLYDFPLNDVSFDATLRDDDIDLPRIEATFSEGTLRGRAFLTGPDATRQMRFDFHLANASLGHTITTVDDFLAEQKNQPPDPPTKFIQRAADIRFDLAAAAEGRYHDPFSFTGRGATALTGTELGQIHLLGLLSPLFPFTSLRFTDAQANFTIAQNKLSFPEVNVTGANSTIKAKGDYRLDQKTLDFNAKVYPFGESKFLPGEVLDKFLTPVSMLAEVKLTGTLDQPKWAFAYGPTNFFRKLTQSTSGPPAEKPPPAETGQENFSPYLNP
ncbi:MAG TPA: AsmA-like C-terminal region-containing protein [Opitutaceae bacterium]|nr:AsmA-like C-terminal region-containing protein [Opitutaceae bacterium]